MPLEAALQGLWLTGPKTLPAIPFRNPISLYPVIVIAPCRWQAQSIVLERRIRANAINPDPIETPITNGMVQRGTRLAFKDKPRERCASGAGGKPLTNRESRHIPSLRRQQLHHRHCCS